MQPEQQSLNFDQPPPLSFAHLKLSRPLVFFDLETTGLDANLDRIVQFAFLRVSPDQSVEEWSELVNPGMPIPPEATRVHRITDDMVANRPLFAEFAVGVKAFIAECDLAGYNIVRFDVPFLQAEMERNGQAMDLTQARLVDAQVIYHKREKRDLASAYRLYCQQELLNAHDAMADVRATAQVLSGQLARYRDLPRDLQALNDYCTPLDDGRWVTPDRKFYWRNNQAVLSFGKHKGQPLQWVHENDPDYLQWMAEKDFAQETKSVITDALNGIYPQRQAKPAED